MPKYNKNKRQRRQNALKMNEILKRRKIPECALDDENNYSSLPITENDNELNTNNEDTSVNDLSQKTIELQDTCLDSTKMVEDGELQISCEAEKDNNEKIVRRRIIDVSHFFSELIKISNHGPLGCSVTELQLIGETQNGLESKFSFKCQLCNQKFIIENDNCSENYLSLNKCAVAGTIAIGAGNSQLNELLSSMNLPSLSEKIYATNHDIISEKWESVSKESMKHAAEKEREFALANNKVNRDGLAIIDVVADGCWSKRSYKKNYNALSGAAAIIGKHTGKILFLGVKNKYCCICAHAEPNKEPAVHKCFKNYDGPSSNMESEIIVEGFKESVNMYSLIYGKLISDGDSSTYAKILEARPYPDITVEKIECRNHVLRNFCNKLQALSTDTRYIIKYRKFISKSVILKTRAVIFKAIKKHKINSDVQLLFEDIMISHLHGFGDHTKCRAYFCDKIGTNNLPNDLILNALWQKINLVVQNVAGHARSLINDVDSNVVERYHSVVAKLVGGKRVNFSKKNSYQARCHASAVKFNEKKTISRLYKLINMSKSPEGKLKRLENRRIHKNEKIKFNRKPKNRITFQNKKSKQDKNYGQDCLKPDLDVEMLSSLKDNFLKNLNKTSEERISIERKSILQGECSEWLELRRSLLTASNFGKIITRRNYTSCHNFVKNLLYKNNIDHVSSISHGKENEKVAINQLEVQENIKIEPCGLFLDAEIPFLGATPDGICGSDTIVEIKCPFTAFKLGLDEAIKKRKITFWKSTSNGLEINKNHHWYYQIQGQLHITQRSKCLFAMWYSEKKEIKTEIILRDDSFWYEKMEEKLKSFYLDCILPELIDPRYPRGMSIRNPSYIENAIIKKKEKSKENIKPIVNNIEEIEETESDTSREREELHILRDVNIPTCSRYLNFQDM